MVQLDYVFQEANDASVIVRVNGISITSRSLQSGRLEVSYRSRIEIVIQNNDAMLPCQATLTNLTVHPSTRSINVLRKQSQSFGEIRCEYTSLFVIQVIRGSGEKAKKKEIRFMVAVRA